jgi:hypothetical protein
MVEVDEVGNVWTQFNSRLRAHLGGNEIWSGHDERIVKYPAYTPIWVPRGIGRLGEGGRLSLVTPDLGT